MVHRALVVVEYPADREVVREGIVSGCPKVQPYLADSAADAGQWLTRLRPGSAEELPVFVLLELADDDGAELLVRMRRDPLLRSVPVIVLVREMNPELQARAYALGGNSCILRPHSSQRLRERVEQLCSYWAGLRWPQTWGAYTLPHAGAQARREAFI